VPRTSGSAGGQNNGYSPWSFAHGPGANGTHGRDPDDDPREPRKDVV
jgi:hypothetical protein